MQVAALEDTNSIVKLFLTMYTPDGYPKVEISVERDGSAYITMRHGERGRSGTPLGGVNADGHVYLNDLIPE